MLRVIYFLRSEMQAALFLKIHKLHPNFELFSNM
jgi:hypothetical protein